MKSLTDQFISDLYGSLLHVEAESLSSANINDVYDGLGNKSSLSLGMENNGAVITGSLSAGNLIFPSQPSLIKLIDYIYPVGSCLLTLDSTNPATRFIGTTWVQVSQGMVITGVGTGTDAGGVSKTVTVGANTGGFYQQTLSSSNIPDHFHYIANEIEDFSADKDSLISTNYLARGGRLQTNPVSYRLEGNAVLPSVGRTSGVVGASQITPITLTNPSYGVYVWNRIS